MTRQTARPATPRTRSPGHTIARQQALATALSAIPDTGDDWTVAAFIGPGTFGADVPGMDLHRRRASIFTATRVEALVAQVVSVRTGGK